MQQLLPFSSDDISAEEIESVATCWAQVPLWEHHLIRQRLLGFGIEVRRIEFWGTPWVWVVKGHFPKYLSTDSAHQLAIDNGKSLTQCRGVLGYRRWGDFLRTAKLPFGEREAEMYIRIAANAALANPRNHAYLPTWMTSLYVLSSVTPEAIQRGLKSGEVHVRMSIAEAKRFAEAQPSLHSRRRFRRSGRGPSSDSPPEQAVVASAAANADRCQKST